MTEDRSSEPCTSSSTARLAARATRNHPCVTRSMVPAPPQAHRSATGRSVCAVVADMKISLITYVRQSGGVLPGACDGGGGPKIIFADAGGCAHAVKRHPARA